MRTMLPRQEEACLTVYKLLREWDIVLHHVFFVRVGPLFRAADELPDGEDAATNPPQKLVLYQLDVILRVMKYTVVVDVMVDASRTYEVLKAPVEPVV